MTDELAEKLEQFGDEKWESDFKPTYRPDWNDGQIHLDGEKDFPVDRDARKIITDLQERCEVVGGLCTQTPEEQKFTVTSQFGSLIYTVHYDDDHQITEIDLEEHDTLPGSDKETKHYTYTVDELIEHAEVMGKLMEEAEWEVEIDTDSEPVNIRDM